MILNFMYFKYLNIYRSSNAYLFSYFIPETFKIFRTKIYTAESKFVGNLHYKISYSDTGLKIHASFKTKSMDKKYIKAK